MDQTLIQTIHAAKAWLAAWTGLSNDACHVHVGLLVFCTTAWLARSSHRTAVAWLATAALALAGELVDRHDDMVRRGAWLWWESAHDLVNTLFWPTALLIAWRAFRRHATRWR